MDITWKKFFEVFAFVVVFAVPVILYLMEKAGMSLTWIFVVGWLSIAAAALYLALSIPWVWEGAPVAVRVWRVSLMSAIALLAVGYGATKIWPNATKPSSDAHNETGSTSDTKSNNKSVPPAPDNLSPVAHPTEPKGPSTRESALHLQRRIFSWGKKRMDERVKIQPQPSYELGAYFQRRYAFDQVATADFTKDFFGELQKMIVKLKSCGAKTKQLETTINDLSGTSGVFSVANELRNAAYDFSGDDPKCAGAIALKDKDTGIYTIVFGRSSLGLYEEQLSEPISPIEFSGVKPFTLYVKNHKFFIDTRAYEWVDPMAKVQGHLQFSVIGNRATYPPQLGLQPH